MSDISIHNEGFNLAPLTLTRNKRVDNPDPATRDKKKKVTVEESYTVTAIAVENADDFGRLARATYLAAESTKQGNGAELVKVLFGERFEDADAFSTMQTAEGESNDPDKYVARLIEPTHPRTSGPTEKEITEAIVETSQAYFSMQKALDSGDPDALAEFGVKDTDQLALKMAAKMQEYEGLVQKHAAIAEAKAKRQAEREKREREKAAAAAAAATAAPVEPLPPA